MTRYVHFHATPKRCLRLVSISIFDERKTSIVVLFNDRESCNAFIQEAKQLEIPFANIDLECVSFVFQHKCDLNTWLRLIMQALAVVSCAAVDELERAMGYELQLFRNAKL